MQPRAKLLVDIPIERVTISRTHGRYPIIGDVLSLDQGFTNNEGEQMVLACCYKENQLLYEVEVYDYEIGPNINH